MDVRMQQWMLWGTGGEVLREKIRYRNKKMDEIEEEALGTESHKREIPK